MTTTMHCDTDCLVGQPNDFGSDYMIRNQVEKAVKSFLRNYQIAVAESLWFQKHSERIEETSDLESSYVNVNLVPERTDSHPR